MTIDERIEKLTEALDLVTKRHESLAHSLELLRTFHQEGFAQVTRTAEAVLDSIKRLENIACSH